MNSDMAFASPLVHAPHASFLRGNSICLASPKRRYAHSTRATVTMSTSESSAKTATRGLVESPTTAKVQVPADWPPESMTEEWAEAVLRLASSRKGISVESADDALDKADGDEMAALEILMKDNRTEIQRERERAVERARASGDANRVSAVKEAEMRRKATGSARDFFKGYVELEGRYIDSGYVDEDADTMGKFVNSVKGWFGKK